MNFLSCGLKMFDFRSLSLERLRLVFSETTNRFETDVAAMWTELCWAAGDGAFGSFRRRVPSLEWFSTVGCTAAASDYEARPCSQTPWGAALLQTYTVPPRPRPYPARPHGVISAPANELFAAPGAVIELLQRRAGVLLPCLCTCHAVPHRSSWGLRWPDCPIPAE